MQILRGIAVVLVAMYHFEPHFRSVLGLPPYSGVFSLFGFFGVDLFFVISGFVIWPLISKRNLCHAEKLNFLAKRMLRIYFPYLVVMVVALHYRLGNPSGDIPKSLLLYPQGLATQYLPVAWTLVFEVVFYLIGFGLMFIRSIQWRYRALAAITLLPVIHAATTITFTSWSISEYYLYWGDHTGSTWLDGSISGHFISLWFLEFFAGVSVSYWLTCYDSAKLARHVGKIWMCAIILFITSLIASKLSYGPLDSGTVLIQRISLFGISATLIFVGMLGLEIKGITQRLPLGVSRLFEWLGDGSYSIYLLHSVIYDIGYVSGFRDWCLNAGMLGWMAMIGFFFVTTLCAGVIGNYLELPVYRALTRALSKPVKNGANKVSNGLG